MRYNTEQKRILSEILSQDPDRAYTADELLEEIRQRGAAGALGKSTLYRLLSGLVEEGKVSRFSEASSRRFVYRLSADGHCDSHLHLKCLSCGRLIHLDEHVSDELLDKVRASSDFSVSEQQTVLFGKCKECKDRKN